MTETLAGNDSPPWCVSAGMTLGCCGLLVAGVIYGQTKAEFEVASIKPSAPDARGMFITPGPGGGVTITNMTLKEMIVLAWRVQPHQISGGPAWIDSIHYDVVAKPEGTPQQAELPLMIQSLLEDRFQLAIRRETKELPIYALVVARKDGKLGPGLKESKEGSCEPPDPNKPPPPLRPGERPTFACGGAMMSPRSFAGVSIKLDNLMPGLSRLLGRTVVDRTGLTGNFDITVEWTPDETQALQPPGAAASGAGGPSIFAAFQEQLGLKFESQKGPVEILVIERAERPSEN
jgi:uncharacterized protein (TIGR03435 family)